MAGLGTPFISETMASIGVVTGPTAGQTLVSLSHTVLGAGYWSIRIVGGATGTATPAPLINNTNLMRGASVYARLFNMPSFIPLEGIWYMILGSTDDVSIQAIANEDPGITYNIGLRATRVA